MITSKIGQRLAGLCLMAVGCGGTAWSWYTALSEGSYNEKAVTTLPVLAMAGLAPLLFPLDLQRIRIEHGVTNPEKFAHLPLTWKILAGVALLAGLGNWLAISLCCP